MRKIIATLMVLLSQSHGLDYLKRFWSNETPIQTAQDYAQKCFNQKDHPVLSQDSHDPACPLRGAVIPMSSLVYSHDSATAASDVILQTSQNHHIRARIVSFHMEHSLPGLALAKQYPLAVLGIYATTFLLPAVIATPLWTIGLAGGLGYTWWSKREEIAESFQDFQKFKQLSGIQTSLGQALTKSQCRLEPAFQPNGLIQFRGNIPNGLIPGQSLFVDLVVNPVAELH
ncbi:MAG: hypothetical protein KF798_03690 [Candidatus Paracaedibacteraceae bacterium]|nr:hypothetical protein [Candidatus Paracaedibacteraceae bacterium]